MKGLKRSGRYHWSEDHTEHDYLWVAPKVTEGENDTSNPRTVVTRTALHHKPPREVIGNVQHTTSQTWMSAQSCGPLILHATTHPMLSFLPLQLKHAHLIDSGITNVKGQFNKPCQSDWSTLKQTGRTRHGRDLNVGTQLHKSVGCHTRDWTLWKLKGSRWLVTLVCQQDSAHLVQQQSNHNMSPCPSTGKIQQAQPRRHGAR